ncbi:hypothetical protein ACFFX0_05695 [Citricoccus parietis]|uniref:Uncharacterized protein n=1 Tax=Citricoccus parietis TaxID=592307 RepID=A0ABV5FVJ7_9MICC
MGQGDQGPHQHPHHGDDHDPEQDLHGVEAERRPGGAHKTSSQENR